MAAIATTVTIWTLQGRTVWTELDVLAFSTQQETAVTTPHFRTGCTTLL